MKQTTIYLDNNGNEFVQPKRSEFEHGWQFIRAYNAWKDAIAIASNTAFDKSFNRAMIR